MTEDVLNWIKKEKLMTEGDTVIVGLSGGADSVALLLVLLELRQRIGYTLLAIHVEHGIRGDLKRPPQVGFGFFTLLTESGREIVWIGKDLGRVHGDLHVIAPLHAVDGRNFPAVQVIGIGLRPCAPDLYPVKTVCRRHFETVFKRIAAEKIR